MTLRRFTHRIHRGVIGLSCLCIAGLLAVSTASGERQYEVRYDLEHNLPSDGDDPTFTFYSPTSLSDVEVVLERGGEVEKRKEFGDMRSGASGELTIEQPVGTRHYLARIRGELPDGEQLEFALNFDVRVVEPLEVKWLRDDIDIDRGVVPIHVNRPIDRIELAVSDSDNRPVVQDSTDYDGRRGRINAEWDYRGEVKTVAVTVHDADGNWETFTFEPFWVEIPQQIINFDTGSATIRSDEVSKLETTRDRIREAIDRHADQITAMRLYVAGYTDTVGPASRNLQLSEQRAQSIARWFRNHDIDIPIYYQGFGQEVLAVQTPNETEEEKNRRAVFILGNAPPADTDDIPRSDWNRLR